MNTAPLRVRALGIGVTVALIAVATAVADGPGPVPAGLRGRLELDPFYQKYLDAGGLPVLGSSRVSDNALAEAAWIVRRMLAGRPDALDAMAGQDVRAVVMAKDEYTTDVPEHAGLRPKQFWDRRARCSRLDPKRTPIEGWKLRIASAACRIEIGPRPIPPRDVRAEGPGRGPRAFAEARPGDARCRSDAPGRDGRPAGGPGRLRKG